METSSERVRGPRRQVRYRGGLFVCQAVILTRATLSLFFHLPVLRCSFANSLVHAPLRSFSVLNRCATPQDTSSRPGHRWHWWRSARPRMRSLLLSARQDDRISLINSCRTPSFPTRRSLPWFLFSLNANRVAMVVDHKFSFFSTYACLFFLGRWHDREYLCMYNVVLGYVCVSVSSAYIFLAWRYRDRDIYV